MRGAPAIMSLAPAAGLDGLGDYLGAHILDQLDAADHAFLISTSVLEEVSVDSAVALGIDDAAGRLASLRSAPIPALWSADPPTLRCHSRFREYLRGLLDQRGNAAVRELRAAHGRLLARRGFHEEAVEELLAAGALTDAYTSAKRAILGVIDASGLRRCRSLDRGVIARCAGRRCRVRRSPADACDRARRPTPRHPHRRRAGRARAARAARGNIGTRRRADGMVLPARRAHR